MGERAVNRLELVSSQGRVASAVRCSSLTEPVGYFSSAAFFAAIESNVTPNFALTSLMMRSASACSASLATRTSSAPILTTLGARAMSARTARLPAMRCSASTLPSRDGCAARGRAPKARPRVAGERAITVCRS